MTFRSGPPISLRQIAPALALFLVLFLVFGIYVHTEKRIDRANDLRHRSILLADQLRQSSDDLSRMARSYVVSGNPIYKRYYHDILDIRDGKKKRPAGYFLAYWDMVLADSWTPPAEDGEAVPLLELMRKAGFSAEEFAKVVKAKERSDELATLELAAMKLAEAAGPEAQAQARRMLHDENYDRAKAKIMGPINEFYRLMDQRTLAAVRDAEINALFFRIAFVAAALGALFMLWRAYGALHLALGGALGEVRAQMLNIGRGDFSTVITVRPGMESSVLAGLAEMRARLQALEAGHLRAEASLRATADSLKEAQRIARLGSWSYDPPSGGLFWSDETYRILELDPARVQPSYQAFLAALVPEDREVLEKAFATALATRSPYETMLRVRAADGKIKWLHEHGTLEFDAAGELARAHGTVQDVTARKQAEEQLRIAATAFESQEGMMITDADGIIVRVNQAFTKITGYDAEEMVGKPSRRLHSDRYDEDFYRVMNETIHRTSGWQGEIWDRRKNGELYPQWLAISAVRNDEGTLTHYVGMQTDITERKRDEEKIRTFAFFDQLTGLPNRTLFLDRLRQAMTTGSRDGNYGALLFIDLDNFKTLNDTLGHDVGDLLLRRVAERLSASVRKGDTVARLGGDEFVVTLAGLHTGQEEAASQAEAVGRKILAALNQAYLLNDMAYRSTPSIGVTLFRGHLAAIDDLMKQADLAMYKAKEAGRNTLRFFDPVMETALTERAELEKDLREALQEKQLLLHYQAQITGSRQLTGAEVLVRWRHPRHGLVSPAEFIPLAEETGLILPLGHWVLETACSQLAQWATHPAAAHLTVAVNVSARQFRQENFVDQVLAILENTGADPRRLKLELTESLLVQNVEEIIEKMFALKARGVGFSLDDFGTGYSSLAYLKRLPLDQLKIDQSFVRDVLDDPNDASIARTIIALAQNLGLGVIAEGVETEAQRDFLAQAGCHHYQGYFYSRPLPLADFEAFARKAFLTPTDTQAESPA